MKIVDKRKEIIKSIIKDYGYKSDDGSFMISMRDLSFNINNTWKARYFTTETNKKHLEYDFEEYRDKNKIAFKDFRIFELFRPIKTALGDDLILLPNGNRPYYILYNPNR